MLEMMQAHSAPSPLCPECYTEMTRLVSQVGVIFKGGGFYVTDSKPTKTETKESK